MQCRICPNEFTADVLHSHHIWPREYGGTDEDGLEELCGSCHTGIHAAALLVWAGKPQTQFSAEIWPRAERYAKAINFARRAFEAGERTPSDHESVNAQGVLVATRIPPDLHRKLQIKARRTGNTQRALLIRLITDATQDVE